MWNIGLVTPCDSKELQYNVGPNEDFKNLSLEDCDTLNYVDWIDNVM
jgi:hypothetical protein